jgi:hypothetical protein
MTDNIFDWSQVNTSKEDTFIINRIARRALEMSGGDLLSMQMSLEQCHHFCPLDLAGLLNANMSDFAHDIGGILRHLNHATGQLEDGFYPRFAAKQ